MRDHPPFEVVEDVVRDDEIARMNGILADAEPEIPGQSGVCLKAFPNLEAFLGRVKKVIAQRYRKLFVPAPELRLELSSFRIQKPSGAGKLRLHHDGHIAADMVCTVWLPLCAIDLRTPSLECSGAVLREPLEHKTDELGYSVMVDEQAWPDQFMRPLLLIPQGGIVILTPLCLHRSYVRPWHTKTRRSLDLRFFSREHSHGDYNG